MFKMNVQRGNKALYKILGIITFGMILYSCASIGTPDGGAYDETPPRFVKSTPEMGALDNKKTKIEIYFDEYVKLEKANEKVVVSPPQIQTPEIKPNGKKVTVNLLDSLKPNTTYTIDFSDAIEDNNEGNPLGNFAFTFSTGNVIDTLEVSGTVLEAANLEPVKGMLVGLHANLEDSAFVALPFDRVGRTDSRGRFSIKGVAPGTYRIYGLMDSDQDFIFSQKSEKIAFSDSLVVPRFERRIRQDTIWRDTLTVDTVLQREYTHYLPDNILLRAFTENSSNQYFVKSERPSHEMFSLYFAASSDSLPVLTGLNFSEKDAFIIEKNLRNDTIHYWVKDSLIYNMDTLEVKMDYFRSDSLGALIPVTDTLYLMAKKIRIKAEKKKKNKENELEKLLPLEVTVNSPSTMDIYGNISLLFAEPVLSYDTASIHLEQKIDTLWHEVPFLFRKDSVQIRKYMLLADWQPEKEYRFTVDSAAFKGLYGKVSELIMQELKVRSLDEYSALYMRVPDMDSIGVVELLNDQDVVVRRQTVLGGEADFYFLAPGKYYVRMFADTNRNGIWDTGSYAHKKQPEEMLYYPQPLDLKAMWEIEQDWNIHAMPLDRQKPDALKKQKPDDDKKKKLERARNR